MKPDDIIDWPEAINQGGFYFERARHLGLPPPPAAAVYPDRFPCSNHVGTYHLAFKDAEVDADAGKRYR